MTGKCRIFINILEFGYVYQTRNIFSHVLTTNISYSFICLLYLHCPNNTQYNANKPITKSMRRRPLLAIFQCINQLLHLILGADSYPDIAIQHGIRASVPDQNRLLPQQSNHLLSFAAKLCQKEICI